MKPRKIQKIIPVPGTEMTLPVTEIIGAKDGGTMTLSAGVHSREYIGVQALIELSQEIDPQQVRGKVILLPSCNYQGFLQRSADVVPQDGKNLNREFPGDPCGTAAQRLAAFLEQEFIQVSDYLVDLHSGGFCETLTPHLYFHGTADPEVCVVSRRMGELTTIPYLVESSAENGFYSWAGQRGVPAILLERGGCGLVIADQIQEHKQDVLRILRGLGFLEDGVEEKPAAHQIITHAFYEDAPVSGCWYPYKAAGNQMQQGEALGEIRDIFGNTLYQARAKVSGVILYQTASLGIEQGTPMVAYGELPEVVTHQGGASTQFIREMSSAQE